MQYSSRCHHAASVGISTHTDVEQCSVVPGVITPPQWLSVHTHTHTQVEQCSVVPGGHTFLTVCLNQDPDMVYILWSVDISCKFIYSSGSQMGKVWPPREDWQGLQISFFHFI